MPQFNNAEPYYNELVDNMPQNMNLQAPSFVPVFGGRDDDEEAYDEAAIGHVLNDQTDEE